MAGPQGDNGLRASRDIPLLAEPKQLLHSKPVSLEQGQLQRPKLYVLM